MCNVSGARGEDDHGKRKAEVAYVFWLCFITGQTLKSNARDYNVKNNETQVTLLLLGDWAARVDEQHHLRQQGSKVSLWRRSRATHVNKYSALSTFGRFSLATYCLIAIDACRNIAIPAV